MKISILTYGFSGWGGGVDCVRYIASCIAMVQKDSSHLGQLVLPGNDMQLRARKILGPFKRMANMVLAGQIPVWKSYQGFSSIYFKNTFSDLSDKFQITESGSTYASQLAAASKFGADVVLPCIQPPPTHFDHPWVGYVYDFQHRHLPDFFTKSEREFRDKAFFEMLHRAKHVIVNAHSVASDAKRFVGDFPARIHVLPFSPCPQQSWLDHDADVRPKFNINKSYFLICNQFWKHKDHVTAFRGFAHFIREGGDALLVCTGDTTDYRFPDYFEELQSLIVRLDIKDRVRILGHIPKLDQVSLIKTALAMVQPTLFEGGPGGGAAYDAIALGLPVIASDIPVNLEIDCGDVCYFEAGNYLDLARVLSKRGNQRIDRQSNEDLLAQGQLRKNRCGELILKIASEASAGG